MRSRFSRSRESGSNPREYTGERSRRTMPNVKIEAIQTDITSLKVDAIVNAANERMLGGGGVDGAIHRAAGPELLAACRQVPGVRPGVGCPTVAARLPPGFRLPARLVVHTVGYWSFGGSVRDACLV